MKGIELIKRMPLELQKEFAREFVKQKSKEKLVRYLRSDFKEKENLFYFFMRSAILITSSEKGFYYWVDIAENKKFNALPPKSQPTKTK